MWSVCNLQTCLQNITRTPSGSQDAEMIMTWNFHHWLVFIIKDDSQNFKSATFGWYFTNRSINYSLCLISWQPVGWLSWNFDLRLILKSWIEFYQKMQYHVITVYFTDPTYYASHLVCKMYFDYAILNFCSWIQLIF